MIGARLKCISLITFLTLACLARAEVSLNQSRVWRRAKVLEPGQKVFSLTASYGNYDQQFSADGQLNGLGARFTRAVTWQQLLDGATESRAQIENYMQDRRLKPEDIAATANYGVRREETSMGIDWAYGLTKGWMIGVQVPLVFRRTRVTTEIELAPAAIQATASNAQGRQLVEAKDRLRAQMQGMAEHELVNSGYDAVPDQKNSWDWGDISLLAQAQLLDGYDWGWSLQPLVRVPTARNQSVGDFLQTNSDEGNVDVGLTSLVDSRYQHFVFGWRSGYIMQLPDNLKMRLASNRYAVDPSVRRNLGDWWWSALDGEWQVSPRLALNAEYSFLRKTADHYQGSTREANLYEQLARNTDQELHLTRLGLAYRLGDTTRRSGVEGKWLAAASFIYPWRGRNSVEASRAAVELISYF